MKIAHTVTVFDAAELGPESRFWAGVLGGTVDEEDDFHMVSVDGAPRVGVQLAPGHVPPQWPGGTPGQQLHLDLWVTDVAAAHDEVLARGATLLEAGGDFGSVEGFQVYADPAGHPFCLCWHESLREAGGV
jgi:predicted enzyme related to lactoylglutathione lyase